MVIDCECMISEGNGGLDRGNWGGGGGGARGSLNATELFIAVYYAQGNEIYQ